MADQGNLRQAAVVLLNEHAKQYALAPAEAGEGNTLATASILGLPRLPRRRILEVALHNDNLAIFRVRNVIHCGSPGHLANEVSALLTREVFLPADGDSDSVDAMKVHMASVLAALCMSKPMQYDDLMVMLCLNTNYVTVRTRCGWDGRDGEVVVDTGLPMVADASAMPAGSDEAIGAVLQHAALLIRTDEFARRLVVPKDQSIRGLEAAVMELMTDRADGQVSKQPKGSRSRRQTPAPTTI